MKKMPVLFTGHGSPMNAIEDNKYTRTWRRIADRIPKPEVIISFYSDVIKTNTGINRQGYNRKAGRKRSGGYYMTETE